MRWRLLFGSFLCLAFLTGTPAWGQSKAAPPKANGTAADDQQIQKAVTTFVELYNAHKADAVAALFAADARMTLRDGTEMNGREEIKKSLEADFADLPKMAMSVVVDAIHILTPDVAVEEGHSTLFPDGETLTRKDRYTVLHVKKEGRWQMQAVRVHEEETLSAYGELRSLEWLLGEWIDEGNEETVEANFKWDENKSFLIEEFRVVRNGDVVLKGSQRIGWDPQSKQIRSWTFDSAGGFGEGTWTQVDDGRWICKAKAVRADGVAASATRTLTRAAKERVLWAATDRLMGSDPLPDLKVTMVRKPPKPE